MAASAQAPLPAVNVAPPWPGTGPDTTRALREFMKKYSQQNRAAVCAIPLTEVPVAKDVSRMPSFRPSAEQENIDRMPSVPLPAPPCKEEKR
jgi:hypothetical protein